MSIELEQESAEVKHLSPSKIEGYLLCPEAFRYRYVEKIPELTGGVMVAGQAVHAYIEWALKLVRAGKPLPSALELDDFFIAEWDRKIKGEEGKRNFVGWRWDTDDPEAKVKEGFRAIIPTVRADLLPTLRPRFIEEAVKLMYPSDIGDFLVWGQLDMMDEAGTVWDWKTTKGKVSARAREGWTQFAHYSKFAVEITGAAITKIKKTFLVRAAKQPIEIVEFELGPAHREFFARQAAAVWKAVKGGVYPRQTEGWNCSRKFCSFFEGCMGDLKKEKPPKAPKEKKPRKPRAAKKKNAVEPAKETA